MIAQLEFDSSELDLDRLIAAAERFPEIGHGLVDLVQSGDQFVSLNTDGFVTALADEVTVVVRLYPSDRLRVLLAAARARDTDFSIFEHAQPPRSRLDADTLLGKSRIG